MLNLVKFSKTFYLGKWSSEMCWHLEMSLKLTKANEILVGSVQGENIVSLWTHRRGEAQRSLPALAWCSLFSYRHLKHSAATSVPGDSALVTLHNPKSRLSDLSSLTEKCHSEFWIIWSSFDNQNQNNLQAGFGTVNIKWTISPTDFATLFETFINLLKKNSCLILGLKCL